MLGAAFSFIIPVQNFGEPPQKIFMGQKHAKFGPIFGRLRSLAANISGTDEDIQNRSSNLEDLDVSLYPPKAHFSEEHISAPKRCCAPKFLHALENDQLLIAHPSPGTGALLTTFFKGGSKIGLKCNKGALITSELGGVARRNFGT